MLGTLKKTRRPLSRKVARSAAFAVESMEQRVMMAAVDLMDATTRTAAVSGTAEASSFYASSFIPTAQPHAATGSYSYLGWGFLQVPTTKMTVGASALTGLQLQLYNINASGASGPFAGDFDVYFISNDNTPNTTYRFGGDLGATGFSTIVDASNNDHTSQAFGITSPESNWYVGTLNVPATSPPVAGYAGLTTGTLSAGYQTFSTPVGSMGASAVSGILADLNKGTPIRLAIVPRDLNVAAQFGSVTSSTQYPKLHVDVVDAPKIGFSATQYTASQAASGSAPAGTTPVMFTINRVGSTTGTTTIHWAATDDGTNGMFGGFSADVTSGDVTFGPSDTTKTVTINVTTPTSFQSSQLTGTFDLALTDPGTNSPVPAFTSSAAKVVVTYLQPNNLTLAASSVSVNETDGTVTITVQRSGLDTSVACSATVATADGVPYTHGSTQLPQDAQAGRDYTAVSQTVSFAAGDTTPQRITISLNNNVKTFAGKRYFTVSLTNRVNCFLTPNAQETIEITDNAVANTDTPSGNATYSAGIETSGPYYINGFLQVCSATHASFSYLDFPEIEFNPATMKQADGTTPINYLFGKVDSLTVSLYNTDISTGYAGTPGSVSIWALTDDTVATSALRYLTGDKSYGDTVIGNQAGAIKIGTAQFTNNVVGYNDFTVDNVNIPDSVTSAIVAEQQAGKPIRIVVIPNDPNVAVDWENAAATHPAKVKLLVEKSSTPLEAFYLDKSAATVSKTAGTATITFDRSGNDVSDSATLAYALTAGTIPGGMPAVYGTDYTCDSGQTGTVTFAAGSRTATLTINLANDPSVYGDKAFNVTISNPVTDPSHAPLLSSPSVELVTIHDSRLGYVQAGANSNFATVKAAGPSLAPSYTYVEGSSNGANATYTVVDLNVTGTNSDPLTPVGGQAVGSIKQLSFNTFGLSSAVSGWHGGPLNVYVVTNTDPIITTGTAVPGTNVKPIFDTVADPTEGLGSQLGTKYLLGSFAPPDTDGQAQPNKYTLLPHLVTLNTDATAQAGLTLLQNSMNGGQRIRIVVTPADPADMVEWNGHYNASGYGYVDPIVGISYTPIPWLAATGGFGWNSSTKALSVTGATQIIADPGTDVPDVTASGSAALTLAPASGNVVNLHSLSMTGGTLDLKTTQLVLATGDASVIRGLVGSNILSSTMPADGNHSIGVLLASDAVANGNTSIASSSQVLVQVGWTGDLNMDNTVDYKDYGVIDNAFLWNQNPAHASSLKSGYAHGDLNGDGAINYLDFGMMDNAFLAKNAPTGAANAAVAAAQAQPALVTAGSVFSTSPLARKPDASVLGADNAVVTA